jgi:hypothetical protein
VSRLLAVLLLAVVYALVAAGCAQAARVDIVLSRAAGAPVLCYPAGVWEQELRSRGLGRFVRGFATPSTGTVHLPELACRPTDVPGRAYLPFLLAHEAAHAVHGIAGEDAADCYAWRVYRLVARRLHVPAAVVAWGRVYLLLIRPQLADC